LLSSVTEYNLARSLLQGGPGKFFPHPYRLCNAEFITDPKMTRKRFKKPEIPVEETLPTAEHIPSTVETLLSDFVAMQKAVEMAQAGFSMSSIAASLSIPVNTFISWIKKGRSNEEEVPNMPEVILWRELSKGWAIAKGLAEANLSKMDPKFFLTRGPARLLGDDWDEDTSSAANKQKETLDVTADFITALKRLRERGHDLNEIIDHDMLTIKTDHTDKPVDLLEKHGINQVPKALPGPMANQAMQIDSILNLERVIDAKD
jgi:hypothetical protein